MKYLSSDMDGTSYQEYSSLDYMSIAFAELMAVSIATAEPALIISIIGLVPTFGIFIIQLIEFLE